MRLAERATSAFSVSGRRQFLRSAAALASGALGACTTTNATASAANPRNASGRYADLNGLHMYYEVHGAGAPLVLLHGGLQAIDDAFGALIPVFSSTRQVIAVELQGHGRTADIDRPLRYEFMADDIDALLASLNIEKAAVMGFSVGAGVAMQLALRHGARVDKLIVASGSYSSQGMYPQVLAGVSALTPEALVGSTWEAHYQLLAPRPHDWPRLIAKIRDLDSHAYHWAEDDIRAIGARTLLIAGDADIIMPEHMIALFRLRGGDMAFDHAHDRAQLAILPGTTHLEVLSRVELLSLIVPRFLEGAD